MTPTLILSVWLLMAEVPADEASDRADLLASLRSRITILRSEGHTRESIQALEQAIDTAQKLPKGGPEMVRAMNNLGSFF